MFCGRPAETRVRMIGRATGRRRCPMWVRVCRRCEWNELRARRGRGGYESAFLDEDEAVALIEGYKNGS